MSRPYLYHYAQAFTRSHELSMAIARKELDKAGFKLLSKPVAWEHVGVNVDTIAVVTCVPVSVSKTYVHVLATSNSETPAKQNARALMTSIKNSKMTLLD
jgi:hypothetical protein